MEARCVLQARQQERRNQCKAGTAAEGDQRTVDLVQAPKATLAGSVAMPTAQLNQP